METRLYLYAFLTPRRSERSGFRTQKRRNRLSTGIVVDKGPSLLTHFPSASTDLSTRLGSVYFSLSPAVYPGHVCSLEILHFTRGREGMDTIIIKLFGFDKNCCKKLLNSSLFKVLWIIRTFSRTNNCNRYMYVLVIWSNSWFDRTYSASFLFHSSLWVSSYIFVCIFFRRALISAVSKKFLLFPFWQRERKLRGILYKVMIF